jgi:hypothetical protein
MNMLRIEKPGIKLKRLKEIPDIYSGEEKLQFNDRHPIFKTLMKLEFEEVLRNFQKKHFC